MMSAPKQMKGTMQKSGGNYGVKKSKYTTTYDPKKCPPLPNLGATPTNAKKGGYK